MKCSLGISNFLKRSLVFPVLLFSSISLHWSLLAILCNSAFKWVYVSFSLLLVNSLFFTAIHVRPPQRAILLFLHFFYFFLWFRIRFIIGRSFPGGSTIKNVLAVWETQVPSVSREDPLEKEMKTHSSFLAWRSQWTEDPGGLQSWSHKESERIVS